MCITNKKGRRYFPSTGTDKCDKLRLFSVHSGWKKVASVRYFPSTETDKSGVHGLIPSTPCDQPCENWIRFRIKARVRFRVRV